MAKPMTVDDRISNKIERYKAHKDQWDLLQVMPFSLTNGGPAALFWSQKTASGTRPDGSVYVVTLDEDNPQNNYAVEAGAKVKEGAVALVLHVAKLDSYGRNPVMVCRAIPWAFGGDKWEQLKIMAQGDMNLYAKNEILVRCSPTKEEKYQDLVLQFAPDPARLIPLMLANPQWKAKLDAEYVRGVEQVREFLRPDTRQEQAETVRGQQQGPGQSHPQGFGVPPGMDLTGLPAGPRSFGPFPAPQQAAPPPSVGIPGFAPPGFAPPPQAPAAPAAFGFPAPQAAPPPQQAQNVAWPPAPQPGPVQAPQPRPLPLPAPQAAPPPTNPQPSLPFGPPAGGFPNQPGTLPSDPMIPGGPGSGATMGFPSAGFPGAAGPPLTTGGEVENPNDVLDAMLKGPTGS